MRNALLILAIASVVFACGKDNPNEPPRSKLERPGTLPRPPGSGLPDDLRPPR